MRSSEWYRRRDDTFRSNVNICHPKPPSPSSRSNIYVSSANDYVSSGHDRHGQNINRNAKIIPLYSRNRQKYLRKQIMTFNFSKQAEKFLKKQDKYTQIRILTAIHALPYGDIKKLKGEHGYRLRVGDFRILFDKNGEIIYIYKIDNRGQAYK